MNSKASRKNLIQGAALALLGVLFLLDNYQVFGEQRVFSVLPVLLAFFGVLRISEAMRPKDTVVGVLLLLTAGMFFAENLGLFTVRWRDIWPVILIAVGLMVIFKRQLRGIVGSSAADAGPNVSGDAYLDIVTVMSGSQLKVNSQDFTGGDLTVVMAGMELDLRGASLAQGATLHVMVAMGGVEIKVPADWSVIYNGTPLLGGVEDKTVPPATPLKLLTITGMVVMGGVEIMN